MMELMHWGTQFIFLSEAEAMNAPISPASMPHSTLTVPAVYWAVLLAMLALTMGGIWWTPDVTSGSLL